MASSQVLSDDMCERQISPSRNFDPAATSKIRQLGHVKLLAITALLIGLRVMREWLGGHENFSSQAYFARLIGSEFFKICIGASPVQSKLSSELRLR